MRKRVIKFINEIKYCEDDKQKRKLTVKLKKELFLERQEEKKHGSLSIGEIKNTVQELMDNYDEIKEYESINEILESLLADCSELPISKEEKEEFIFPNQVRILGNPGTNSKDYSTDYIEKIIREKIYNNSEVGINQEEIVNILQQRSESMYFEPEEYQKLINDLVIFTIDAKEVDITNPAILKIISDLGRSYKIQSEFDNSLEIYEKGLSIKNLSETPEYEELEDDYNILKEYLGTLNTEFDMRRFESFSRFKDSVEQGAFDKEIFDKTPTGETKTRNQDDESKSVGEKEVYQMSSSDKLSAIGKLLEHIQEKRPGADITRIYFGRNEFESYIICPIDETNITIMENFKENVNEAAYIIENEYIEAAIELRKREAASKLKGVIPARHVKDNYVTNLIKKVDGLLRDDEKEQEKYDEFVPTIEIENTYKETIEELSKQKPTDSTQDIQYDEEKTENEELKEEHDFVEKTENDQDIDFSNFDDLSLEELEAMGEQFDKESEELDVQDKELDKNIEQVENEKTILEQAKIRKEKIKEIFEKKRKLDEKRKALDEKNKEYEEKKKEIDQMKRNLKGLDENE